MLNILAGRSLPEIFIILTALIGTLAIAISVHEAAHAWMANRLGDPTAKHLGRISLNPANHIDPIGTVLVPLFLIVINAGFVFGWAKPTPFNPWNLRNPRRDAALISLAGPISNLALALILGTIFRFIFFSDFVAALVYQLIALNLVLAFFNLIPIPPLDGFKVVGGILPKEFAVQWESLERYGFIILLAFFFFGGGLISLFLNFFVGNLLRLIAGG